MAEIVWPAASAATRLQVEFVERLLRYSDYVGMVELLEASRDIIDSALVGELVATAQSYLARQRFQEAAHTAHLARMAAEIGGLWHVRVRIDLLMVEAQASFAAGELGLAEALYQTLEHEREEADTDYLEREIQVSRGQVLLKMNRPEEADV